MNKQYKKLQKGGSSLVSGVFGQGLWGKNRGNYDYDLTGHRATSYDGIQYIPEADKPNITPQLLQAYNSKYNIKPTDIGDAGKFDADAIEKELKVHATKKEAWRERVDAVYKNIRDYSAMVMFDPDAKAKLTAYATQQKNDLLKGTTAMVHQKEGNDRVKQEYEKRGQLGDVYLNKSGLPNYHIKDLKTGKEQILPFGDPRIDKFKTNKDYHVERAKVTDQYNYIDRFADVNDLGDLNADYTTIKDAEALAQQFMDKAGFYEGLDATDGVIPSVAPILPSTATGKDIIYEAVTQVKKQSTKTDEAQLKLAHQQIASLVPKEIQNALAKEFFRAEHKDPNTGKPLTTNEELQAFNIFMKGWLELQRGKNVDKGVTRDLDIDRKFVTVDDPQWILQMKSMDEAKEKLDKMGDWQLTSEGRTQETYVDLLLPNSKVEGVNQEALKGIRGNILPLTGGYAVTDVLGTDDPVLKGTDYTKIQYLNGTGYLPDKGETVNDAVNKLKIDKTQKPIVIPLPVDGSGKYNPKLLESPAYKKFKSKYDEAQKLMKSAGSIDQQKEAFELAQQAVNDATKAGIYVKKFAKMQVLETNGSNRPDLYRQLPTSDKRRDEYVEAYKKKFGKDPETTRSSAGYVGGYNAYEIYSTDVLIPIADTNTIIQADKNFHKQGVNTKGQAEVQREQGGKLQQGGLIKANMEEFKTPSIQLTKIKLEDLY